MTVTSIVVLVVGSVVLIVVGIVIVGTTTCTGNN